MEYICFRMVATEMESGSQLRKPMRDGTMSVVRQYFDEFSEEYVEKYRNSSIVLYRKKNDFLKLHLQYDSNISVKVLDVGSGGGIWADLFLDDYPRARLFCLDISLVMLGKGRPRHGKHLVVGDGIRLPFSNSRFDLINLDALMHHLVDHRGYLQTVLNIIEFLRSLKSLLKPHGMVILSEIYHESILGDDIINRLLFFISTLTRPTFLTSFFRTFIRTQGVGVCFLSRKQWLWVIAQSGYRIEGCKELKWHIPFLRRLAGFKASGDLLFLLSPL